MTTQASHEDRVKAVTAALEREGVVQFSRGIAEKLARRAVDAVEAADNTAAENRAEVLRLDAERRNR